MCDHSGKKHFILKPTTRNKITNLQECRSNLGAVLLPQWILTDFPGDCSATTRQRSPLLGGHILHGFLCHRILVGWNSFNDGRHSIFVVDHLFNEALVFAGNMVVVNLFMMEHIY